MAVVQELWEVVVRLEGEHFDEMHFWIVDSAVVKRQSFSQLLP